jgi:hypothetical protein
VRRGRSYLDTNDIVISHDRSAGVINVRFEAHYRDSTPGVLSMKSRTALESEPLVLGLGVARQEDQRHVHAALAQLN